MEQRWRQENVWPKKRPKEKIPIERHERKICYQRNKQQKIIVETQVIKKLGRRWNRKVYTLDGKTVFVQSNLLTTIFCLHDILFTTATQSDPLTSQDSSCKTVCVHRHTAYSIQHTAYYILHTAYLAETCCCDSRCGRTPYPARVLSQL